MTWLLWALSAYLLLQLIHAGYICAVARRDRQLPPASGYTLPPRGQACGKAAVMLHGFADTPEAWRREAEALAERGWHVEVPLLSHEETSAQWLEVAAEAIRRARQQAKEVILFGHSMGGALALAVAARERPDALVLWAPFFEPYLGPRAVPVLYALHRFLFRWPRTLTFFPALRVAKGQPTATYAVARSLPVRSFASALAVPRLARAALDQVRALPTVVLLPHRDTVVRPEPTRHALPWATFLMAANPRTGHALTNAADWRENLEASLAALFGARPKRRAILFDIDGTLLYARGLGRPAFADAFAVAYGQRVDLEHISFVGATDTAVIRELAAQLGIASTPAREERFFIELTKRLDPRLEAGPLEIYPGVADFLAALRRAGYLLGVVTGNIRETAWSKLIHAKLADYFDFGAYATDHADRDRLAAIARDRARALGAEPCLLIGDTPKDIQAAHAIGLPCLAVTTGWVDEPTLQAAGADATIAGFARLPEAIAAVARLAGVCPVRVLAWEVTRRCPMACKHCRGASRDEAYAGELTTTQAKAVTDSLDADAAHPMLIFTGGEPMFREDLPELVRHATARGFRCVLAPCGRFATEERLAELKAAGICALSLSIDGPDAATHDAFRGVPGAFAMALRAMAAARAVGLPFQVNHTLTRANRHDLRAMRDFALAQGATRLDVFFLVPVGRGSAIAELCLSDGETEAALDELLALDAEGSLPLHVTCEPRILSRAAAAPTPPKSPFNGCMAGAGFCFLSHTGELRPCGFFPEAGGNVRDFAFNLPAAYRASPLFARLHGGPTCLARALAQHHG